MVSQPYSIRDAYPESATKGRGIAETERMQTHGRLPSRAIRRNRPALSKIGPHETSDSRKRESEAMFQPTPEGGAASLPIAPADWLNAFLKLT
jgi:hypothetical protein